MRSNPLLGADARSFARIEPWSTLRDDQFMIETNRIASNEQARILSILERYGICLVRWQGSSPDEDRLRTFSQWLGPFRCEQNDYRGDIKRIIPTPDGEPNSGRTRLELSPHVDGTQDADTPALLIFQYVIEPTAGGQSTFVDLANVFSSLTAIEVEAVTIALAHPLSGTSTKRKAAWAGSYTGPLIKLVCAETSAAVRYHGSLISLHDDCQRGFTVLKNAVQNSPRLTFMPHEGDLVIVDNWRVLHGRLAVVGRNPRAHDRMWVDRLDSRWHGEYLLGVRPLGAELTVAIKHRHQELWMQSLGS